MNTHYEIDNSFVGFDTSLLSTVKDVVYYDGVPVVAVNGNKIVNAGAIVQGRKINAQQAISLWQHCYLSTRVSHDPEQCARVYRNVNQICHTCCGDGIVTRWLKDPETKKRVPVEVGCTDCEGTGRGHRIMREEELCPSPLLQ